MRKDVSEEPVDDSLLKGKQIAYEDIGEKHVPSPLKQTNEQQDNTTRESDDEDQYFKFISDTFGKPMMDGLEDIFQNQSDLQECIDLGLIYRDET